MFLIIYYLHRVCILHFLLCNKTSTVYQNSDKRMRRNQAVAMALHMRLGQGSRLGLLEEDIVKEFILPYCKREEDSE